MSSAAKSRAGGQPKDLLDVIHDRMVENWPVLADEAVDHRAVIGRVRRLNTLFEEALAQVYLPFHMQEGEYDVLAALMRAKDYCVSPTDIKRELTIPAATVTKRLYSLERKGLIARERHPGDRRALLVRLTPDGLERAQQLYPLVSATSIAVLGDAMQPIRKLNELLRTTLLEVEGRMSRPGST